MFGSEYFAEDYFAGELFYQISPPPTPTPTTYQTLVVPCLTRNCSLVGDQGSDFLLYNLEAPPVVSPAPVVECRIRACLDQPPPDLETYSLQDALFFNGTPLTVVPDCPPGYYCPPGSLPPVTYPPGTFVFPDMPPPPGQPIILQMQGCSSLVIITLPPFSSQAAIDAAAQQVILLVAQQQAICDAINPPGGGGPHIFPNPSPIAIGSLPQRMCADTYFSAALVGTSETYPITYQVISGALPTGLSFVASSPTTVFIGGIPTVTGSFTFIIQATSPGVYSNKQFTMVVVGITNSSPLPTATLDTPYSEVLVSSGYTGTVIWSIADGDLPDGLSLNNVTGEIFGTPTVEDSFNFTIQASDGTSTCFKEFELTVAEAGGFPDLIYDLITGNANELTVATINGYDFITGQPPNGTAIGSSIDLQWTVLSSLGGYTIAFDAAATAGVGDDGTYRVTINNTTLVPLTSIDQGAVRVYLNAVLQYTYDVNVTTGPLFVDIPLVAGDELNVQPAVDGVFSPPSGSYHVTAVVVKL